MTPRRIVIGLLGLVGPMISGAAQTRDDPSASATFGWLSRLAGHCWQAESPHGSGQVTSCWSLNASRRQLELRTRDATGVTALAVIRGRGGALSMQTVVAGNGATSHCWLMPDSFGRQGAKGMPGALLCRVAAPHPNPATPVSWSYRLEPVALDRYRIVETREFGGWTHGFQQYVWLFVRGSADIQLSDEPGTGSEP